MNRLIIEVMDGCVTGLYADAPAQLDQLQILVVDHDSLDEDGPTAQQQEVQPIEQAEPFSA